jgi:hypothetical protein
MIGYLPGLRSTFTRCGGILLSSVTTDQLNLRMRLHPGLGRFCLSIRHYEGFPLVALSNLKGIEQKTLIIAC